jgi:putative copper export protein
VALLLALRGPARGVAAGAGSFGVTAAVVFAAALATGVVVLVTRRNGPAVTMAIHSGLAITGYVLLVAWYSVG